MAATKSTPISKSAEARAARKQLRLLVSIGALDAAEAKAIRKDVLASLKPASKKVSAKSVKVAA